MKRLFLISLFLLVSFNLLSFIINPSLAGAQTSPLPEQPFITHETFVKAKVIKIVKEETQQTNGTKILTQTLQVQILEGPDKDKTISLTRGEDYRLISSQKISASETVILDETTQQGAPTQYSITDTYRLNYLLYIVIAFFVFIVFAAGKKGIGAIVGLSISLAVILFFIIPQMIHGADPLFISIVGALIILLTTTFLAHGFSRQTVIAVVSTFLSLLVTVVFAQIAVNLAHLAGLGTEDSYLLELNPGQSINPKGILLGGIIIGALGALNDITTTQVAAIFALIRTNPKADLLHLVEEGFTIGREHIVSLTNTLVLAYAGSALTIFIFFVLNPSRLPTWVIINNESVAEEVIRTLSGSVGLVLAIPITTLLASWWATRNKQTDNELNIKSRGGSKTL